jgi:FkbM family methyltransferase
VRINDWLNFQVLTKDIFRRRIYHFEAHRTDPVILDCGANIGMATLYFKRVYPGARVISFEPDPVIFPLLAENVARNALTNVQLVQAALARETGSLSFYSDGKYGSCLASILRTPPAPDWTATEVPATRLRQYLGEQIDFLKMNIEGAESDVLEDSADRLRMIREMVVEYHHLPGLPRTLHKLLSLLDSKGFEYLVNDLDHETNPEVEPPFRLTPKSRYFLLIYAKRND